MDLLSSWKPYVVILLLVVCRIKSDDKVINVWCVDDNVMERKDLLKNVDRYDLCKSRISVETPWSVTGEKTQALPENLKLVPRTFETGADGENTRQIAVFVSWKQKLTDLPSSKNYHVELNFLYPPGQPREYIMEWDHTLLKELKNTTAHYVQFNFIYSTRMKGSYHINPRDKYRFKVQGLPMYQETDKPQAITEYITIPGCNNKEIRKAAVCRCPNGRPRRRNNKCQKRKNAKPPVQEQSVRQKPEDTVNSALDTNGTDNNNVEENDTEAAKFNFIHIVLIVVGSVIISSVMILVLYTCKQRICLCFAPKKETTKRRITVISSVEEMYSQPINFLLKTLGKLEHVKLTCNLWQKNDIGECGIVKWVTKNTSDADMVVFIIGNESEVITDYQSENGLLDDIEKHQVGKSLKTTENIINTNKCEQPHKKFIVVDLHHNVKREDLPLFKHYRLPTDLKKFTRHVLGDQQYTGADDKKIFLNLLSNAQLGYATKITMSEKSEEEVDPKNEGQNDFNFSLPTSRSEEEQQSLALNIDAPSSYLDGPPSCESNQSRDYITTDFNNPGQEYRYIKAGARPKVRC